MRTIILKSLSLVNFKGVRDFHIDFTDAVTCVCGDNGTGKTTLFDAYLWLLSGKDSAGRGDGNGGFNVKTLDVNGKPIYRLEHSVTAVLEVDGREIKLQRSLVEKWVKQNGSTAETMKDETQYFINDVRCGTKKEYQAEISEIIPEDVFKMITNPYYFTSLPAELQRDMLFDIAGNISDDDVAAINPEFRALLDQAEGTTLAKLAREMAAKKKACNDALLTIPAQIETAEKLMPEPEQWDELEKELMEKKAGLQIIDNQIADKNAVNDTENERKRKISREIGDKKLALQKRQNALRLQAGKAHNEAMAELSDMESKLSTKERTIKAKRDEIAEISPRIDALENEIVALRGEFKAVATRLFVAPDPSVLCCPTCGEPLKGDNLQKTIDEIRGNFEQNKATLQKEIQDKGKRKAAQLESLKDAKTRLSGEIARLEDEKLEIAGQIELKKAHIPAAQNADELISTDTECITLTNDIAELENQLNMEVKPADISELQEAKSTLTESIAELNRLLGKRDTIARCKKEIAELEEKRIANNQSKTDCERWETTYTNFIKAKDEMLTQRINGLFRIVSFSFVKEQKNGGEKITCFCTVNGTPYMDVNAAGKLNAGLDIINAICTAKGICAPIFIDNRESFNEIIPTVSQIINLRVTYDKSLTIK